MRIALSFVLILAIACSNQEAPIKSQITTPPTESFIGMLDTVFQTEQTPIRLPLIRVNYKFMVGK